MVFLTEFPTEVQHFWKKTRMESIGARGFPRAEGPQNLFDLGQVRSHAKGGHAWRWEFEEHEWKGGGGGQNPIQW